MAKNKNKKKKSNLKPTSPVKVVLPVIIGLVAALVITIILTVVTQPKSSAKVDKPNETFATIGSYKVTNQDMYEALKANSGLTALTQKVDAELLKGIEVSDEDYRKAYERTVFDSTLLANMEKLEELQAKALEEGLSALEVELLNDEIEELSTEIEKAQAEAVEVFEFNMTTSGLKDQEAIQAYIKLIAQRRIYAESKYAEWVADGHDFKDSTYSSKDKEKNADLQYEDTALIIPVLFASSEQAKAYMSIVGLYPDDTTNGWKKANDQLTIDELKKEKDKLAEEIEALEEEIASLTTDKATKEAELAEIDEENTEERDVKQGEITDIETEIGTKNQERINKELRVGEIEELIPTYEEASALSQKEVALAFVEIYNLYYSYLLRGDVSEYFETDNDGNYTTLKDDFKVLVEGVHYTIEEDGVTFNLDAIKALEETYDYAKFEYTKTEANSLFSTAIFNTLEVLPAAEEADEAEAEEGGEEGGLEEGGEEGDPEEGGEEGDLEEGGEEGDLEEGGEESDPEEGGEEGEGEVEEEPKVYVYYTYSPTSASSGAGYYIAYKLAETKGVEKSPLEALFAELETAEESEKADLEARIKEFKDAYRAELVEENYNIDLETKFLLELRQANGLKIYDRYLNATYLAAYNYLYETTLSEADHPEYNGDGGTSKKLAYSFNDKDGKVQDVSAQALFEDLQAMNFASAVITELNQYALLNNEEFNKIYNPYTKKVYDKEKYNSYLSSDYNTIYTGLYSGQIKSVKAYKFAFENNLFESYGFTKKYGWKNFMKDYLNESTEEFLAAVLAISEAEDNFYNTKYSNEEIQAEAQKIYDAYYSMKVLNMVISTDYDLDGKPDTFKLTEGTQPYFTEYQMSLVQELSDKFYDAELLATTEGETLEAKLKAINTLYNNATFQDPTWGKYIAAGLHAKVESSTTYTSSSSLVQEFHDEMARLYKEIEAADGFKLGNFTEDESAAGYYDVDVFTTAYGYHRVTILGADDRVYFGGDKSTDVTKLTMELYNKYQANKDDLSADEQKAVETFITPAISTIGTTNQKNLYKQDLRSKLFEQVKFASDSKKADYLALEELYKAYLTKQIELERE